MNTNLLNIIKRITAEYGEGILSDPQRLKAFFSDLAKDEPKPLRFVFVRCVETGAYSMLKTAPDAVDRAERKAAIAQKMRDEHGLDITFCAEALDILEAALYNTPVIKTPPHIEEAPAPASDSTMWALPPHTSTIPAAVTARKKSTTKRRLAAGSIIGVFITAAIIVGLIVLATQTRQSEPYQLLLTLSGHNDAINSVVYSPEGRRIVSASYDKTVKIWDAKSGRLIRTLSGHSAAVYSAVYSPDGRRIVSASGDKTVKIWDAKSGQLIRTLFGHSATVYSAAYSPDERRIVSASFDRSVKVWDAESGRLIRTLSGHSVSVHSVAYSPDGRRIVSASGDKTVKIWDAESGQLIRTLSGYNNIVNSAVYSPDGRRIVSASNDNTVKVWGIRE